MTDGIEKEIRSNFKSAEEFAEWMVKAMMRTKKEDRPKL